METIEFNLKAKPKQAEPFGGVLEMDHHYMLKGGSVIKIIPHTPQKGVGPNWKLGKYQNGPLMGATKWWYDNGLFQGKELDGEYKGHVIKEVPDFVKEFNIHLGYQYVGKNGLKSTKLQLFSAHDNLAQGPVFMGHFIKSEDPPMTSSKTYWNHKGEYLGVNPLAWTYPEGSKTSQRNLTTLVLG